MSDELKYAYLEKIPETWWAWFAGLLIGEGCIHVRTDDFSVSLSIEMCDKEVIDNVIATIGGRANTRTPSGSRLQVAFRWTVSNPTHIFNIVRHINPYMVGKKCHQLDEVHKLMLLRLAFQQKMIIENRQRYTPEEKLAILIKAKHIREYAGGGEKSWVQKWNLREEALKKEVRKYATV